MFIPVISLKLLKSNILLPLNFIVSPTDGSGVELLILIASLVKTPLESSRSIMSPKSALLLVVFVADIPGLRQLLSANFISCGV